jgi:magnesium transporter
MISVYRWDAGAKASHRLDSAGRDDLGAVPTGDNVTWVDLQDPTPEEEQHVLGQWFPVHSLTLEDVTRARREPDGLPHLPKVEEFPDYLFVVTDPLDQGACEALGEGRPGRGRLHLVTQLSAVLTPSLLVTHHYKPLPSVDALRDYLARHDTQAARGPDFLFHLMLDDSVDRFGPTLDILEDHLDRLEERVFARPAPVLLARLVRLKRVIVILRKTIIHEREVLARLQRGDIALIDERERAYYRNVYDHLLRFSELIEGARDMVSDLMQSLLAATSNRLNEIMKALTMVSTVVLPMTLIAGIYGMNFKHMPELDQPWGYPLAVGLMALTGLGALVYFKWKRWI